MGYAREERGLACVRRWPPPSGLAFLGRRANLIERIPFENSPEILAGKGRETVAQLGYS